MDNRSLEKESIGSFYVIIADRDGVKKYISRSFPKPFQYTVKINKARRFNTEEQAWGYINNFNEFGRYSIVNPEVKMIIRKFELSE